MELKELFLAELSELSKKHGLYIEGCGCCDSPFMVDESREEFSKRLEWDNDVERYVESEY